MIYRTTDMSKEELANQLLWALADPENRLFAKPHAHFIIDLLNYAVVHLSPQSAAKLAGDRRPRIDRGQLEGRLLGDGVRTATGRIC